MGDTEFIVKFIIYNVAFFCVCHYSQVATEVGGSISKLHNGILVNLYLGFSFTICEVLFGIIPSNNDDLFIVNYLLLLGKWCINNKSVNKMLIFFLNSVLKNKLCMLSNVYNIKGENDKFRKEIWKSLKLFMKYTI